MKQKQMIKDLAEILTLNDPTTNPVAASVKRALIQNCTDAELAPVAAALTAPKAAAKAKAPSKAGAATGRIKTVAPNPPTASGCVTTAVVGPYGTEMEAGQEAIQFKNPRVFFYRSAIFPTPQNFGVEVTVTSAKPVRIENPNPLYPYGVELELQVTGAKAQGWLTAFRNRARLFNVKKS